MPIFRILNRKRTSHVAEKHHAWKGDAAKPNVKRKRARTLFIADQCEVCGDKNAERHHKDANTGNNTPENIAILCRRCHMIVDGRLEKFKKGNRKPALPPRPCKTCGCIGTVFWYSECHKCNEYRRRHGVERPNVKDVTQARKVFKDCPNCGRKHVWISRTFNICKWCCRALWTRRKRSENKKARRGKAVSAIRTARPAHP